MSDREALMAKVCERPEDDNPRLVIADYFQENGETVRAEFVRDCVWMAANYTDCPVRLVDLEHGRPVPLRCGSCEYCLARRRAEKFYAKHIWLPGVNYAVCFEPSPLDGPMPTGPGLTLTVSRGFVSTVSCRLADWAGTPCVHCNGTGLRRNESCAHCDGQGVVNAHGPRIVAGQPVQRVTTEKRPFSGMLWIFTNDLTERIRDASLPTFLRGEFTGKGECWVEGGLPAWHFDSELAAQSALSLALVNWARREAGLPPLTIENGK